MEPSNVLLLVITVAVIILVWKGIKIVPQQQQWVAERFGRFDRVLDAGLNFINPFFTKVAYKHSMKEQAIDVREQTAITKDNVTVRLDGIVYLKVMDAKQASYGVENPFYSLTQLAQTTMRSEIGKMDMEKTFEERDALNVRIVEAINQAASAWGITCMRYEIRDIKPPETILRAMEQQVTADREKRAVILESEGKRQAAINQAEGERQAVVLESEAAKIDQINRAQGEAEAIKSIAEATAEGVERVATAVQKKGGSEAVALKVAEKYVEAFGKLAKEGNTLIVPANANDAGNMVAQALTVFNTIQGNQKQASEFAGKKGPWSDA